MAMAKVNRFARFYGADVDANCAKMAVINLCLNTMYGEVAWMNSLTNQYFGGWRIEPTIKGIPRIREITKRESYIHLKLPENKRNNQTKLPISAINAPTPEIFEISQRQLLFEF